MRATAAGLTFRPITDADLPFLARLYASTRMEELAVTDWSDAQKAAFLQSQFDAQHAHYQKHYAGTDFLVDRAWRGSDRPAVPGALEAPSIASSTSRCCPRIAAEGLGTALLPICSTRPRAAGKAVTIHVEKFNPAMSLYRRLGFVAAGEDGAYDLMRWEAPA